MGEGGVCMRVYVCESGREGGTWDRGLGEGCVVYGCVGGEGGAEGRSIDWMCRGLAGTVLPVHGFKRTKPKQPPLNPQHS